VAADGSEVAGADDKDEQANEAMSSVVNAINIV
jgi:hypothetical protein